MPTTTASTTRLEALAGHLASSPSSTAMSQADSKPPITCHVLDTTLGKPASNIPVRLTLHNPSQTSTPGPLSYTATTNSDGRVTAWTSDSKLSVDALEVVYKRTGDQKYSLTFDTEGYFGERGIEPFFPEVEVKFTVRSEKKSEHYHVPVLLGPFGYTTYRGS